MPETTATQQPVPETDAALVTMTDDELVKNIDTSIKEYDHLLSMFDKFKELIISARDQTWAYTNEYLRRYPVPEKKGSDDEQHS